MYQFFSKVGIEPTFTVYSKDYPVLGVKTLGPIQQKVLHRDIANAIVCALKRSRGWASKAYRDDTDVELPSPGQYTTMEALMVDYAALQKRIAPFKLYPSSVVDYYNDGGCHINVGMADVAAGGYYFQDRFDHNLLNFLNAYPTLVWSMLTPNDNQSSQIYDRDKLLNCGDVDCITGKGWCANNRGHNYSRRWELRFFMMPRTDEEMIFQLKVADRFIRRIFKLTRAGVTVTPVNSAKKLAAYRWPKAKKELTQVAQWLELEKEPLWEEKLKSLRERIEVQGKEFLV